MKTPMSVFVMGVAGCFSSALLHAALVPPAAAADSLYHSEPAAAAFHDRGRREGPSQRDRTSRGESQRAGLASPKRADGGRHARHSKNPAPINTPITSARISPGSG